MRRSGSLAFALLFFAGAADAAEFATKEGAALRDALVRETAQPIKPAWRPMLLHLAELHGRAVLPPVAHLKYPYETIGPGYQDGRVFGHIDLTHERIDSVRAWPEHARNQIRNELAAQQADGLIPGIVQFSADGKASWKNFKAFPPIWVVSADLYVGQTKDTEFLRECLAALKKQLGWFETKRSAPGGGYYYLDILQDTWESGMDEGIRYHERPPGPAACVDATAHVFMLYEHATRWSKQLGEPAREWQDKANALQKFIREKLWDPETGFFYDAWVVRDASRRHLAFEGIWPVVVGAATDEQAKSVIGRHLLNPREFFAPHPITTVAQSDSRFELRMWRGPTWNCMTYWAARGCARYGEKDAARRLLEAALDATAKQFERTGTIWEFYDPKQGSPENLVRKPSARKTPWPNYLGHNPLFAMADLWRQCGGRP